MGDSKGNNKGRYRTAIDENDSDSYFNLAVVPSRRSSGGSSERTLDSFVVAFSDPSPRTVETVVGLNRYGRLVTEALIKYMEKRIKVEQSYLDGMKALAAFKFPALEDTMCAALKPFGRTGGEAKPTNPQNHLYGVHQVNQAETNAFVDSQSQSIRELQAILDAFKRSYKKQVITKKSHKYSLKDQCKVKEKKAKELVSLKKTVAAIESRIDTIEADLGEGDDALKNHAKVDKLKAELNRKNDEIASAQRTIADAESRLEKDIKDATIAIYNTEQSRLQETYQKILSLYSLIQVNLKATQAYTGRVYDNVKMNGLPEVELQDFAARYADTPSSNKKK